MFGSDSAPHPRCKKEACGCAAGVFTAPLALPKLAEIFARHGALDKLQGFVSGNACRIHGLKPHAKQVTLHDAPMSVPSMYADYGQQVVPMYAGEEISWSVKACCKTPPYRAQRICGPCWQRLLPCTCPTACTAPRIIRRMAAR